MLEKSLATLFALLILATLINRFLLWRLPERKGGEVTLRIRTWWGIVICFSMVISGPRWMTLTFFALISFLALKEYCTLISVHFPRWLYWGIPLNYLLIGFNCFELFLLFMEGANKRGNSSRLTQSFHFFMFEPIFSPVNALNQPI